MVFGFDYEAKQLGFLGFLALFWGLSCFCKKKKMGKRRMIWFWFCFRRAEWLVFWCFNLRGDMVVTSDLWRKCGSFLCSLHCFCNFRGAGYNCCNGFRVESREEDVLCWFGWGFWVKVESWDQPWDTGRILWVCASQGGANFCGGSLGFFEGEKEFIYGGSLVFFENR